MGMSPGLAWGWKEPGNDSVYPTYIFLISLAGQTSPFWGPRGGEGGENEGRAVQRVGGRQLIVAEILAPGGVVWA